MELKPGYKQTEVGVIPEDWEVKNIGTICNIAIGRDLIKEDFSIKNDQKYNYPVFSNALFNKGLYGYSKVYQYEANKITVTARGDIGSAIYRNKRFCAIGRLLVLSSKLNCDLRYVAEYINNFIRFASESTGVPQLTAPQISKYNVALPPTKAEQKAIAEILSDADAFIESLEQLIAKKRLIKQGTIQELLTGKRRLPEFNKAPIVYKQTEIGVIPQDWKVMALYEIFNFSGGLSASRDQLGNNGYCYLHYGDIHTSSKTYIDLDIQHVDLPKLDTPFNKVSPKSILCDGDVVFVDASEDDEGTSRHQVIRNLGNIPFISGLHTIVAKGKNDDLENSYKCYCFQSKPIKDQFRFYSVGTKVSGISKTNIAKIFLFIPPREEQKRIADILSDMDTEIGELETKLTKARQIKQGMMHNLLTGKIRLIQKTSKVVPLSRTKKSQDSSEKSHNRQFTDAVIISVLTKHFGSEQFPLGRKRYTKFSYLLHRHLEGKAEGYLKKAAGPYNPETRYNGAEKIAKENGYIRDHKRDKFTGFIADKEIDKAENYFSKWYGETALNWLKQFQKKTNDELELLATVDMAMQELHQTSQTMNLKTVKKIIQNAPEWKAKLQRDIFSDDNITRAIKTCQKLFA